jgi:O-antigen ligase
VAYVPEKVVQRLATTGSEVEGLEFGGRFKVWNAGLQAFVKKPLLGYGTSSFKGAAAPYGGLGKVAHNSFLSVLVEQGMVGLLLYSMMFIAVFLAVLDLPIMERRFALVLLATLGMAMLPLTWEDRKPVWFILAALLGLSKAGVGKGGAVQPRPLQPAPIVRAPRAAQLRETLTTPRRRADLDTTA